MKKLCIRTVVEVEDHFTATDVKEYIGQAVNRGEGFYMIVGDKCEVIPVLKKSKKKKGKKKDAYYD